MTLNCIQLNYFPFQFYSFSSQKRLAAQPYSPSQSFTKIWHKIVNKKSNLCWILSQFLFLSEFLSHPPQQGLRSWSKSQSNIIADSWWVRNGLFLFTPKNGRTTWEILNPKETCARMLSAIKNICLKLMCQLCLNYNIITLMLHLVGQCHKTMIQVLGAAVPDSDCYPGPFYTWSLQRFYEFFLAFCIWTKIKRSSFQFLWAKTDHIRTWGIPGQNRSNLMLTSSFIFW